MICANCSGEFDGRKRRYCSADCRGIAQKKRYKRPCTMVCQHCGSAFEGRSRKYCNQECRARYERRVKLRRARAKGVKPAPKRTMTKAEYKRLQRARAVERTGKIFKPNGSRAEIAARAAERRNIEAQQRLQRVAQRTAERAKKEQQRREARSVVTRSHKRIKAAQITDATKVEAVRSRVHNRIKRLRKKGRVIVEFPHGTATADKVGYSMRALAQHIERQFVGRMNWARFLAGDIHVDHIVACAHFDLSTVDGLRAAFAMTNLAPAWADHNIAKGAKKLSLL